MELSIKNEKLIKHFNENENSPAKQSYYEATSGNEAAHMDSAAGKWMETHPEAILYGYFSTFLGICDMNNIEIDLTYDKIKNIGAGLSALFNFQKKHCEHMENIEIVAKTLASVLSYIAINEHDYWFCTINYPSKFSANMNAKQSLWAEFISVAVGKKNKYADFMPCCMAAAKPGTVMSRSGMTLTINGVVKEYEKLTGVNLTKYGLSDLFIN